MNDFAERTVALLNELLEKEPEVIESLVDYRTPCGKFLADHPTVQVLYDHLGNSSVGILGVLNGIAGVKEDGYGYIIANYCSNTGRLIGFTVNND